MSIGGVVTSEGRHNCPSFQWHHCTMPPSRPSARGEAADLLSAQESQVEPNRTGKSKSKFAAPLQNSTAWLQTPLLLFPPTSSSLHRTDLRPTHLPATQTHRTAVLQYKYRTTRYTVTSFHSSVGRFFPVMITGPELISEPPLTPE